MVYTYDISSSQDDIIWFVARRSDGEVGMIPRNYVKEKGEDAVGATIASHAPLKAEAKMTDVPDEDEGPTANPTKHGEPKLCDMQVRSRSYKGNECYGWCLTTATV